MSYSFSKRITLAMVALAVGGILLSALLINLALSWNFGRYLGNVQEEQNRLIVDTLAELYSESTSWQAVRLSTVYVGLTTGTQIRVFDLSGRLIADSLTGMSQGMHGHRRMDQEIRGETYNYPLYVQKQQIGTVEITTLGQKGLWTREALIFRRTVQASAIVAGLIAIIAAIMIARMLARRLTGRLNLLTVAAEKWGQGRLDTRVQLDGNDELAVLGETMNRMATRLEEQSAVRKKLTNDISHELRTPLTTIQSYLEAFRDKVMPADAQNIQAVLEESHRLGRLVNDLQELTKAEYRGRSVHQAPLVLNTFLTKESEHYRPLLQKKRIGLTISLPQEDVKILADESLLVRVMGNLFNNAAKYTPEEGHVTVELKGEDSEAVVEVRDTGIGIDAAHLPYIFERFYRVDPSRTRATGGSGIGLAIVKELAEAMGGRVEVTSDPGKGSRFRLYFKQEK